MRTPRVRTYLADANILLSLADPAHPNWAAADTATRTIRNRGDVIQVTVQALWEFYDVATRPATSKGGFGFSSQDALMYISTFRSLFPLCAEVPLFADWESLMKTYGTTGVPAHDARYVAAMKAAGITHLLTFNVKDFIRYQPEGIVVVHPSSA